MLAIITQACDRRTCRNWVRSDITSDEEKAVVSLLSLRPVRGPESSLKVVVAVGIYGGQSALSQRFQLA